MPLLTVHKLAELTGKQRVTLNKRLDNVPFTLGNGDVKPQKLYDSKVALEYIYCGGAVSEDGEPTERIPTQQEAARDLSIAKRKEIDLKMEVLRKERIPLEDICAVNEQAFLHVAGLIKSNEGKMLTAELVNDIFTGIREIGAKLKLGDE